MPDVLLTPPQRWYNDVRALPLPVLPLTFYPRGLILPDGLTLTDVAQDLQSGAWLTRDRAAHDDIFRLGGRAFELRIRRQQGRTSRLPMAVVLNVDESRSVPRKVGWIIPERVEFNEIWFEVACDLEEIAGLVREHERRLSSPDGRSAAVQSAVREHGWLQAEVRRQYGELQTLVDVLEQRPESPEESAEGTVVEHDGPRRQNRSRMIFVKVDGKTTAGFRNQRVQLTRADGRSFNTRVRRARGDRLEITEPRDWSARPQEKVRVAVVRPFGMRQEAQALDDFLAGKTEGSWDDLARLLCRPSALTTPGRFPLPAMFYCDEDPEAPVLNDEQRRAVAGAIGSPHAFLVQGPPGTGKSEVIGEVVRQLVGRGERVLLLAPSHVAVDEVLGRIGRKPGVRPLRITWSDDMVDERLHAFLPRNLGFELASKIMRPSDDGQVARWERERHNVDGRLAALTALRGVEERKAAAVKALRAAAGTATGARERLRARREEAAVELAQLERRAGDAERRLTETVEAYGGAVQTYEATWAWSIAELERTHDLAAGVRGSGEALIAAAGTHDAAVERLHGWLAGRRQQVERALQACSATAQAVEEAQRELVSATRKAMQARSALEQAIERQTRFGRIAESLGVGPVTGHRRKVADAEHHVTRWSSALDERERLRGEALARHERLTTGAPQWEAELREAVNMHAAEHRRAVNRIDHEMREFVRALNALPGGGPVRLGQVTVEQCVHLGGVVASYTGAVLSRARAETARAGADFTGDRTGAPWPAPSRSLSGWPSVRDALDETTGRMRWAVGARDRLAAEHAQAAGQRDRAHALLRSARIRAGAEVERLETESAAAQATLTRSRSVLDAVATEHDRLAAQTAETGPDAETRLLRRRHVLGRLPELETRWRELTAERNDPQLLEDIQHSLVRATNLVCATTKGIVGRGSDPVRHTDYDTLIVDEASRVTESQFLIGAVRARRWVLVGDEHQLPPHVDQNDEHFLHALTALHRREQGDADSLEQAIEDLADMWAEDEELRVFRSESVRQLTEELDVSGKWESTFRDRFSEAHQRFVRAKRTERDADRALLGSMVRYLVQSLFQRAVARCPETLREPLIWQRRMIASLADVVNEPIYEGRYLSPPDSELERAGVIPLITPRTFTRPGVFIDTSRYQNADETQIKHGFVNELEQRLIVKVCEIYNEELSESGAGPVKASVLAFYRAQAQALERQLLTLDLPMLDWQVIDVIDRIQGQQSDLVILSFTRARRKGFGPRYGQWLQDVRRLNVACTRARRALVLVGHGDTLKRLGSSAQQAQARKAREFYENLLRLFDEDSTNFQRIWRL